MSNYSDENINFQPFTGMHSSLLPFAMAWMGKGDVSYEHTYSYDYGYNLLYQFVRSMPTLFEQEEESN